MKKNMFLIFSGVILLGALTFSYLKTQKESQFNPFTVNLNSPVKKITLRELNKDKIVLMYFGFLSCPDACPTTLSTIGAVFKDLPQEVLEKISFVFVDLDPERDSILRLKEYSAYFHPRILPVTLPLVELDLFTRYFGIAFMKVPLKSSMGYTIDHSTDIIVLSPEGKILDPIHHGSPKIVITNTIKKLFAENFKK